MQVVDLACGETIPAEIIAALTDTGVTKWAFNVQFERICLSRWLRKNGNFDNTSYSIPEDTVGNYLNPASWKCTMIWSAYMGLPLSLEGVGAVLGLGKQKMTEGKELIKYFCQPCAPTKTNGGRTRNLPENAPDKWDSFKRYNIRDVEVEMSIQEKLAKFPVPEAVWNQYHLDQKINDRGVALDMELVHQAIAMDTRSRKELTDAMKKLTALDNPKEFAVTLQPSDVLHIPGLGFDGLVGYSPIAMAKNAIGMAIACEEYGAKFFANGAAPGGVLEHPGTIKDPQRVRESWQSTFGGSGNANKIAVLEEGMKYTPIGISPEQAQFLETRKFQINEIARIFRVPPHMVGDLEKSSFSNIEQQSLEFVKYTLDPWVIRWEQSIQRSLLSKDEKAAYFVKFNLEGLLRGDYQSRMNGYAIGRQNGWMSANDIRELENLDRIPAEDGGDLYLINGNMLPLKNAGAFADTPTDDGKEEETDEEILELEEPSGDQRGDAGTDSGEDAVSERNHRRGKLV